jgi:hypothetical protein
MIPVRVAQEKNTRNAADSTSGAAAVLTGWLLFFECVVAESATTLLAASRAPISTDAVPSQGWPGSILPSYSRSFTLKQDHK